MPATSQDAVAASTELQGASEPAEPQKSWDCSHVSCFAIVAQSTAHADEAVT